MVQTILEKGIIYSCHNGIWVVGTNTTTSGNAIPEGSYAPSILIIPKRIRGHKIEEIGVKAFREHKEITAVNVFADIRQINHHAFSRCSSIAFINIPPSAELIFPCAFFNGVEDGKPSDNSFTIIFEPEAKIKQIFESNFLSTKSINVYYCGSNQPLYNASTIFSGCQYHEVYTPNGMEIFGETSTQETKVCHQYPLRSNIPDCLTFHLHNTYLKSYLLIPIFLFSIF